MLLDHQPVGQRRIHKEMRKYLQLNDNEKTTCLKFWGAAQVVLKEKRATLNTSIRKKSKIMTDLKLKRKRAKQIHTK